MTPRFVPAVAALAFVVAACEWPGTDDLKTSVRPGLLEREEYEPMEEFWRRVQRVAPGQT